MSDYGIKASSQDKSVFSPNILDESLNNKYPLLKAFKQGSVSVKVTAAGTFTADASHGLGYIPVYIYFAAPDPTNPQRKFFGSSAASGPGGTIGNDSYADVSIVRFAWEDTSAAGFTPYPYTVTFYYYIFYDKLG